MNNFIFENKTKVYFGKGCVGEYLPKIAAVHGDKVLLAYGGGSIKKNGVYEEVIAALEKAGKTIIEFPGIMENPTYKKVLEGTKLVKEKQVDWILAVGGGSVMDCSKAISMAAVSEKDVWDEYWAKKGVVDFEPMPLGVIVTASGTGSECNGGAVITNEEVMIKTDRDYPKCNPEFALMDPTYTYTVPTKQMVAGSFDILSHVMETYFSEPDEDNVSDDISEALMRGVITNLRAALVNPEDYTARSNLMWLSTMAENRIIKLGKKCDFECTSDGASDQCIIPTAVMDVDLLCCIRFIIGHICQRQAQRNLPGLRKMYGEFREMDSTDEEIAEAGVEALG